MNIDPDLIYSQLEFPAAPVDRPYVYLDMVTTIDGKILSGDRDEDVLDLGSNLDHALVRRIASVSDGVIVGAETVRRSPRTWNPPSRIRIVVTRSGDLPFKAAIFSGESYVAAPSDANFKLPTSVKRLEAGKDELDFVDLLRQVKGLGVDRLLGMGGSRLNGQLIGASLVDELFLTIAPKVKLGDDVPTYAGGKPFSRTDLPLFDLVEHHVVANELFLRYRKKGD